MLGTTLTESRAANEDRNKDLYAYNETINGYYKVRMLLWDLQYPLFGYGKLKPLVKHAMVLFWYLKFRTSCESGNKCAIALIFGIFHSGTPVHNVIALICILKIQDLL